MSGPVDPGSSIAVVQMMRLFAARCIGRLENVFLYFGSDGSSSLGAAGEPEKGEIGMGEGKD